MKNLIFTLLFTALFSNMCYAWDGYDYENGDFVEIDKGNNVKYGNDVEVYNYSDGKYYDVRVEDVNRLGNSVEVEVYNYDKDRYETYEMD